MKELTVDLVTEDPINDEYVVYLVEDGPWTSIENQLRKLQERLYDSFDMIVDGHVATKFPQSLGRKIRLQVDSYNSPPRELIEFVWKFSDYLKNDSERKRLISNSPFIAALRLVNGSDIGRSN